MRACLFSCLLTVVLVLFGNISFAQINSDGYNPQSLNPVHESYKMYKRVLWRRMDMLERQNAPFFSMNGELSTIIINAVKQGLLFPYTNDSCNTRMSKETFLENLKFDDGGGGLTEEELAMGFGAEEDDFFGDSGGGDEEEIEPVGNEFPSRDFSIAEIREEMYFDRLRSRMFFDILSITINLPADKNPAQFEKPLASFRYKDLVALFRSMPNKAIWYNSQNSAEHRNLAEAFDLRLFSSMLIKYGNPGDNRIVDIYTSSRKAGLLASRQLELDLIEFENELWEY